MTFRLAAYCLCLAVALPGAGRTGPAEDARAAVENLEAAAAQLDQAETGRDRVLALSETVRAFEAGLAALRDGVRRAADREAELSRSLEAREEETAALAGTLMAIAAAPPPVLMAHPDGPLGAARSGMMLAELTPALEARSEQLRQDVLEMRDLRLLQETAADTLREGLAGVQEARAELSLAMADRTDLPKRFTEDPIRVALLIAASETLDGFASGLASLTEAEIEAAEPGVDAAKGTLDLPVTGRILRRAGETDAAGITRPGIVIATRSRALVVSPTAATVRYVGPLLDLGNVVMLEPAPGTLFILSGLAEVYGQAGDVLPAGAPVGLMGGPAPDPDAVLSPIGEGGGSVSPETLYMEVRQDGAPVDPESWFRT
ncbi:murein hydrolase activator EnvC family protein [Chachezhania antarctica]|uniref:murein hydrolase activator EnvC family protein n=1 Tax=Chachezhania antarctica TaxID=2340860 RepID=UPI000EAE38E4|nr:peptidoglycan DD-metalloendopeptidase family protein [Chachezhania antarctica]|tara:strand:+ start:944 stop:2068 length:1125 start_codon:yes stop_codon:yes gene_type:complete